MNILVIGGFGFIGAHVVKRLAKEHCVFVLDKAKNPFFQEEEGVVYLYGDFTDELFIKKSLKDIELVYHLLSTTTPLSGNLNPQFDVSTNLIGSIRLFEKIQDAGVKRVIFASSGGTVYGNPVYLPINEEHSLKPIGSYGITKVAIEHYLQMFASLYGFSYLIVRPSNAYGPGQAYHGKQGVVSTFLHQILLNEELSIWGDGSSIRDYIYIDDVADFFVLSGLSDTEGIFNLGSGKSYSLNEILKSIEHITGKKALVNRIENNKFNVSEVVLDISKAKQQFKWQPKTNMNDGIKLHYEWIKKMI